MNGEKEEVIGNMKFKQNGIMILEYLEIYLLKMINN